MTFQLPGNKKLTNVSYTTPFCFIHWRLYDGFQSTFANCSSLTSLPADLFRYNTGVTTYGFLSTFQGCNKLQQNANIFHAGGEQSTRFLNRVLNFSTCFSKTTNTGLQGIAPDLCNYSFGTQTPTKTTCWGGSGNSTTSLTNYASIPAAWK